MGKTSPPFWHPSFDFSEVVCWPSLCTYCALFVVGFWFVPFERPIGVFALVELFCRRFFGWDFLKGRSPLAFLHLLCVFAEGFWFGPFEGLKPLGVFALVVRLCRRFFGSDLFKGRSPLAFLHFLCVCFDKYAKFAESAYFANLLFCLACRCLPKLAILAA